MPVIEIRGMTCGHCAAAVRRALEALDGVSDVAVDLECGTATYREAAPVSEDVVKGAIEEAGYELLGLSRP